MHHTCVCVCTHAHHTVMWKPEEKFVVSNFSSLIFALVLGIKCSWCSKYFCWLNHLGGPKAKIVGKKKKFAFTRRYWEVVKLKPECFILQCPTETSVVWVCLPVQLYMFLAFFFSLVSLLSVFLSICFVLFNFFFYFILEK